MAEAAGGQDSVAGASQDSVAGASQDDRSRSQSRTGAKRLKKPRLAFSSVHDYFTKVLVPNPKTKADQTGCVCNDCGSVFTNCNSSTLKKHLSRFHPKLHDKVISKDTGDTESSLISVAESLESGPVEPKRKKGVAAQDRLSTQQQAEADEALAEWIATSNVAIHCVDNPRMEAWVRKFNPKAKVPSRTKLTKLVNKTAERVVTKMKEALYNARKVSLTGDAWSVKNHVDQYLAMSAHFLNPVTKRRETFAIRCAEFNCQHLGTLIAKKIKAVMHEYGLELKIFLLVTDGASNMIKAGKDLKKLMKKASEEEEESESDDDEEEEAEEEYDDEPPPLISREELTLLQEAEKIREEAKELEKILRDMRNLSASLFADKVARIPCAAHKIHLVACHTAKSKVLAFEIPLKKARKLVKRYNKSGAKAKLKEFGFPLRLKQHVETRWWTDVVMVRRLLEAWHWEGNPLDKLITSLKWKIDFSSQDIKELQKFLLLMEPLETIFSRLNGDKSSTIHLLYPTLENARKHLKTYIKNEDDSAHQFALCLESYLNQYFNYVTNPSDEEYNGVFLTATFISPLTSHLITPDLFQQVKLYLMEQLPPEDVLVETEPVTDVEFSIPGYEFLDDQLNASINNTQASLSNLDRDLQLYREKVPQYLARLREEAKQAHTKDPNGNTDSKVKLKQSDPLHYWLGQEVSGDFRSGLPQLCQDILASPVTSTTSERIFSHAGSLSQNRSSSISPKLLESRVLCKVNADLLS